MSKPAGGRKRKKLLKAVAPLTPQAEARFRRGLALLLGLVPLSHMTQAETDWVFQQKVRLGGE